MTRSLAVALVALLWTFPSLAQAQRPAPPNDIAALLDSTDTRRQAWGVWIAGRDRISAAQPRLEQIVATALAGDSNGPILDFALDALIELDARLPPDLIARIAEQRPTEGLILLSRVEDGTADAALLEVMRREHGYAWLAAANQLLVRKPAGFAAELLTGLRLKAQIIVSDDGLAVPGPDLGSGIGIGCGVDGLAEGMPPWPSYTLSPFASPGNAVVALGPTPIYYERRVSKAGHSPSGHSLGEDAPTAAHRLRYIAEVLGMAPELLVAPGRSVARGRGLPIAQVESDLRRQLAERHADLVHELIADGHLTEEEAAALTVDVDVTVDEVH